VLNGSGIPAALYDQPGNVIAVYLETSRDHENAPHEIELRWRAARDQLTEAAADPGTLDEVAAGEQEDDFTPPGRAGAARDS
jgi:hypothetical protein